MEPFAPGQLLWLHRHGLRIQWNLWNKDTAGSCKSVLISEVSLIRRFPGTVHYSIGSNSGLRTLVCIVEVSVIGGVRFRKFHCITIYQVSKLAPLMMMMASEWGCSRMAFTWSNHCLVPNIIRDYYDRSTLTAMVKPPFKPTRPQQGEPGNEFRWTVWTTLG